MCKTRKGKNRLVFGGILLTTLTGIKIVMLRFEDVETVLSFSTYWKYIVILLIGVVISLFFQDK